MISRKWKFWLALLGVATLVGLLEGAQVYTGASAMGRPVPWSRALGSTMPSWYVLVALLPGIFLLSRRFPFEPGRWQGRLPIHLAAAVVFAVLHITLASWISDYVLYEGGEMPFNFRTNLSRLLTIYFVIELVTYFAVVGAYHAYDYARRYREREYETAQLALKASRLEASLSRANLDSLRMQLNPHFLFNTLNAISVMAMKGERQGVVRMLSLLSDLLRLSLDHRQQVVSLREELEILDRYLEIEHVRFRDRLNLEREIDPEALDAEVPSLLLQPLVENALRHGIARRAGPGLVRVEARIVDGEAIELRVLDTGPGPEAAPSSHGTGVGLANTRARLEQLYGDRHELTLTTRPEGGACVTVRLPLRYYTGESLSAPLRRASA
ncbi:MAG TPA: histidine kinase [Longimicrobiales bacterium]